MMRAAAGLLGRTCVLTTTRLPIAPLERDKPIAFRRIDVESLSIEAAIALARRRGVTGTDEELAELAHACGRHALDPS